MNRVLVVLTLGVFLRAGLGPAAAAEGPGSIRFLRPRPFASFVGSTIATVQVEPPQGATIVKVVLRVDGVPVGSASSPPWAFSWSAGDGTMEHVLEAVASYSDATEARASIRTSRVVVNEHEEVALVSIYAIARAANGAYVSDLFQQNFRVFENGRPQALDRFSAERRPLRIAIVLDSSYSMLGEKLSSAIDSATAFLPVLQPGDEGLVIGFSDDVQVLQDLTSNRRKLGRAIRSIEAHGGTALYDAIHSAASRLAAFDGRRVVLLLSDGRDEAGSVLQPGSRHSLEEARDLLLRNEVMVFAIGLGKYLARDAKALAENPSASATEMDVTGRQPLAAILSSLAEATGGTVVFAPSAKELRRSFEQVAEELRHQYHLAYLSDDKKHDGTWREIKVVVDRPGVSLTNRKGYFAPAKSGDDGPR